jgi:cytochrome c-type biogenesis protein CcmF
VYFSDLGTISLILALGFALYTIVAAIVGARRELPQMVLSAQCSLLVLTCLMVIASIALITSLLIHDFGVVYVANESSRSMPWYYVTAAFYGGQEGSLLYWATMLSIFSAIFLATTRHAPTKLVSYVMATLMSIEIFFLFVLTTISNPFLRSTIVPSDGKGLNPLLMDPGMLVHPPLLLMGYMSFSLPFAFAIAALITGQFNSNWLRATRSWTLAAWTIQTAGLILGAWWAYHVLGWGGYWGWDPVENVALLPWLTATAFLHSAMVQERRGMLKIWNLGLLVATFALSIFGTFEVRSGLINSVHSFVYSNVGPYYLTFLTIILAFSLGLIFFRLPQMRVEQRFDSVVSREGMFLFNNLLLVGITFAILWGTLLPLISASVRQQTMTVGPPFYNQVVAPLLALLILTMGIGPLLAWQRTSPTTLWRNLSLPAVMAALCAIVLPLLGITDITANIGFTVCAFTAVAILYELWRGMRVRHSHGEAYPIALWMLLQRDRQRYGGYIVHLGLLLLVVGVIGSHAFQLKKEATLNVGQDMTIGSYRLTFLGSTSGTDALDNSKIILQSQLQIWQNGQLLGYIYPGRVVYTHFGNQPTSTIPIKTFGVTDLYVILDQANGLNQASFHVFLNPLVPFIWYGGIIMCLGGIICWWPQHQAVIALKSRYEREQEIDAKIEEQLRKMKENYQHADQS